MFLLNADFRNCFAAKKAGRALNFAVDSKSRKLVVVVVVVVVTMRASESNCELVGPVWEEKREGEREGEY